MKSLAIPIHRVVGFGSHMKRSNGAALLEPHLLSQICALA